MNPFLERLLTVALLLWLLDYILAVLEVKPPSKRIVKSIALFLALCWLFWRSVVLILG